MRKKCKRERKVKNSTIALSSVGEGRISGSLKQTLIYMIAKIFLPEKPARGLNYKNHLQKGKELKRWPEKFC